MIHLPGSINEAEIISWLASDNGFRVHIGVFVMLLLGGIGMPIPEDLPVLLAGVAASKNIVAFQAIFITCYFGVILSDHLVFLIGYCFGPILLDIGTKSPFLPGITEVKLNKVREGLRKKRLLYIFIGRHLFPLRTATFLTAGALRIPLREFALADSLAALVSVALMLCLGHLIGERMTPEMISHLTHTAHWYILAIVILSLLIFAIQRWIQIARKTKHF